MASSTAECQEAIATFRDKYDVAYDRPCPDGWVPLACRAMLEGHLHRFDILRRPNVGVGDVLTARLIIGTRQKKQVLSPPDLGSGSNVSLQPDTVQPWYCRVVKHIAAAAAGIPDSTESEQAMEIANSLFLEGVVASVTFCHYAQ
jgi:hypothetical protein